MKLSSLFAGSAVALLGLFTGAMLLIAGALLPYWTSIPVESYRAHFQALGPHLGSVMIPLMLLSIGLSLVALCLNRKSRSLWAVAFICVVAIVPLYGVVHAPVNELLLGTGALSGEELLSLRAKWGLWHWARTVLGASAMVAAIRAVSKPV